MSYTSIPLRPDVDPHEQTTAHESRGTRPRRKLLGQTDAEQVALPLKTLSNNDFKYSTTFITGPVDSASESEAMDFSSSLPSDPTYLNHTKRTPTNEKPKTILRHDAHTVFYKILPHIAATLIIIAIVQLSFREQYWMDLVPPDQHITPGLTQSGALNALQLAAKMVELVILASLAFVVKYTCQRYLLGKSGLPLGLMASPHQVITGELLRRRGFWSAWNTKSSFNGATPWVYTPFWLMCLAATLLVMITGPSAAIAVIPTLDWFPVSKPFTSEVSPYYVFNATTGLWPKIVTQDSLNGKDSGNECLDPLNRWDTDCPAGGFRILNDWTNNLAFDNLPAGSNISTPNDRGDTRRITNVRTCDGPVAGRATAMSITSAISNALVGYWNFARNNFNGTAMKSAQPKVVPDGTQSLYSPRVDVICSAYQYNVDTISKQTEMVFPSFNSTHNPRHVPSAVLSNDRLMNDTDFIFIQSATNSEGLSINGLATIPASTRADNNTWLQATVMLPCSIYAQWAPISAWYEPTSADQVSMQTLDGNNRCLASSNSATSVKPSREALNMTITPRFAESINQPIAFVSYNRSVLAALLDNFIYESRHTTPSGGTIVNFRSPQPGSGNRTQFSDAESHEMQASTISAVIAGVAVDALSRVAGAGHYPYSPPFYIQPHSDKENITGLNPISTASGGQSVPLNITAAELGNYVRLNPSIERFGYGYNLRSATARFGVSILLVHLILALGHTCLVLYKVLLRREGIGNSLDTIGEIVALALNSDKSERIQNTCGGISESETWREIVAVREVDEGHLEMVVGEEKKDVVGRARVGMEYGRVRIKRNEKVE